VWKRSNRAAIAALSLAALIVAGAVGAIFRPAAERAATPRRVSITFPAADALGAGFDYVPFTLSSDGALLAYSTDQPERVNVRRLDDFEVTRLTGTDGGYDPFFSPDNQWLGFWAFGQIKRVPVAGGPPVVVCEAADMLGASWGENGSIVFAPGLDDGLYVVPDTGGTPQALTTVDSARNEIHHGFPQYVDGGRAVLFTALARSKDAPYSVEIVDTATKQRRTLVSGAQYGRYLPTGHLVYVRNSTLFGSRVTPGTFVPVGEAVAVIEDLHAGLQGHALFSTANNGTLVYVAARAPVQSALVWVDRNGAATETGLPIRAYHVPRVSADGRTIAVDIVEPDTADLWVAVAPSPLERLTFGRRSLWTFDSIALSPDGAHLAYAEDGNGGARLMTQALDRGSAARELLLWKLAIAPSAWLAGGKGMLLNVRGATTGGDLFVLGPGEHAQPVPLVQHRNNQFGPTPSADGRYVAYASDETGRFEIFATPYPGPGDRQQLTTDGGREPIWSRKGDEIFYRQGDRMMSIPVTTGSRVVHGPHRVLFEGRYVAGAAGLPAYDVTADGRFLMLREEREGAPLELRTVLDWFTELNRNVP
jgi:serine/threonine-protein kinase